MRDQAHAKNDFSSQPFLFAHFNITRHYAGLALHGIARHINPLICALNEHKTLPKYILMIPDRDILTSMKTAKNFGVARIIGAVLHYLIKQIDLFIERRCQEAMQKKSGALMADHPKVVWMRMLKRPPRNHSEDISALRGKFNSILEERLQEDNSKDHHIMSIQIPLDEFDLLGNLTSTGKITFWKEVDRAMQCFHADEIKLKPCANSTNNTNQSQSPRSSKSGAQTEGAGAPKKHKLPTSPPVKLPRDDHRKRRSPSAHEQHNKRRRSRSRSRSHSRSHPRSHHCGPQHHRHGHHRH